jgi:hypothetical protein
MRLLKKYEERLVQLKTQQIVIEKEINWVTEIVENLKKEIYKTSKIPAVKQEAETNEFENKETAEAVLIVLGEAFPNSLHQRDIAREMFRRGWHSDSKTPEQTVGNTLFRLIKKKEPVERSGRGTFRLKKRLKSDNSDEGDIPF